MVGSMDRWSWLCRTYQAVALLVGIFGFGTTLAVAQQQPNTTPPKSGTQKVRVDYSAWVKICDKSEKTQNKQICLVKYEGLDPKTGDVEVSAAVRTIEGEGKQDLVVGMPSTHTLVIPAGVQVKIDDGEPITLQYKLCIKQSCQAQAELTKPVLDMMRKGERMLVVALDIRQKPVVFKVPLNGFIKTFDGEPVDEAKYKETRSRMLMAVKKAAEDQQRQEQVGQSQAPAAGAQPKATITVPKMPSAPAPQ
jgi:invasion protein IalB